jgi:phosphoglucomutase
MYTECGYAAEDAVEKEFPGAAGIDAMKALIERLRQNPPKEFLGHQVTSLRDFEKQIELRDGKDIPISGIPRQNLLYFTNANGDWIAIRPSGTEPKVKAYVGVREHAGVLASDRRARAPASGRAVQDCSGDAGWGEHLVCLECTQIDLMSSALSCTSCA